MRSRRIDFRSPLPLRAAAWTTFFRTAAGYSPAQPIETPIKSGNPTPAGLDRAGALSTRQHEWKVFSSCGACCLELGRMQVANGGERGSERGRRHGGCHMTRRRKTTLDDYRLSTLTRLFAWLVVAAALAGLIGEVAH